MAGALEGDMFIGPNAEEHRGLLSLKYPMEHGYVNDWSDMERVWQYVYSKEQLNTFAEEVFNIKITIIFNSFVFIVSNYEFRTIKLLIGLY